MTVELGTPHDIWLAVEDIKATAGLRSGFVLSSVGNIIDPSEETWEPVLEVIKAWQHLGHASSQAAAYPV
jgi:hypothetical protein